MAEITEEHEKEEKSPAPLEVKIVNHPEKEKKVFDSVEDDEYDDLRITKEQVEEFEKEDGNTSS